jgi:hypothetical protein
MRINNNNIGVRQKIFIYLFILFRHAEILPPNKFKNKNVLFREGK